MWVGQLRMAGCGGIDKADGLSESGILSAGLTPPVFYSSVWLDNKTHAKALTVL